MTATPTAEPLQTHIRGFLNSMKAETNFLQIRSKLIILSSDKIYIAFNFSNNEKLPICRQGKGNHTAAGEILITVHKRSLRRQCFHKCLSVHGGGGPLSRGVSVRGRVSVKGTGLCQGDLPYSNVRAVRILLECILVYVNYFSTYNKR